ncbi:hypothetical protein HanIR_Chr16g0840181 [Helianthus annuus]|nr:hypothetical protein HanIR_Chr16g0840181 [Helianthus annuus]
MQGPNCKMQGPKWKMPTFSRREFFHAGSFFFIMAPGGAVWAAPYRRYGHGRAPLRLTLRMA